MVSSVAMPELPEVETVCRGLAAHLINASITQIVVRRRDLRVPVTRKLESALKNKKLASITRRAKYILFHFTDGQVLIIHLGMSGRLLLHKSLPVKYLKHDHVILEWANGYTLVFNDPRRFGLVTLSSESDLPTHVFFRDLGPEPLDSTWNGKVLYRALQTSSAPIKSVIMDQRKLVGVGNIYACEALFAAHIHPRRSARCITCKEAELLSRSIQNVLQDAIASGGSTLRDYVRSSGEAGYFQHHFRVYGRQKLPCGVCKKPIVMVRQAGRSTFFCRHCQQ